MITTFQCWNVTPKTVNRFARKPSNGHLSIPLAQRRNVALRWPQIERKAQTASAAVAVPVAVPTIQRAPTKKRSAG
jgi:hypothetical protein